MDGRIAAMQHHSFWQSEDRDLWGAHRAIIGALTRKWLAWAHWLQLGSGDYLNSIDTRCMAEHRQEPCFPTNLVNLPGIYRFKVGIYHVRVLYTLTATILPP